MIKKIHKLLNENNIQQREIAEKMGVHRTLIQKYLAGDKKITTNMLHRIFQSLIEIAKQRKLQAIQLQIDLEELKELMVDMSQSSSIRHV